MEAKIRKATILDAVRLWRNMADIDREEAAAATRIPVLLTLLWGVLFTEVIALRVRGEMLALFGVRGVRALPGSGLIWMLSTRAMALHEREVKRAVMLACMDYVSDCAKRYDLLFNAVYAKNDKALRFVRRLGFTVGEPVTVRGAVFHPIVRESCAA